MASYKFANEAAVAAGAAAYDLNDGTNTSVIERAISGMGIPQMQIRADVRARRMGSEMRSARLGPRLVSIPVRVEDTTHNATQDRVRALLKYMAGSYGGEEPRIGQLRVTPAGESERYLRSVCMTALKDYNMAVTGLHVVVPLVFYADHPLWYNPTEETDTITIGSGAGNAFPWRFPLNFGLNGFSGGGTVNNAGDAETRSLLVSVPGPVTSPGVRNDTVGKYVRLTGLSVASGDTLKIRMGWRPDGVTEHKAVVVSPSGGETNVLGYLDTNSEFFHLEPGDNEVTVTQDTPTTGTVYTLGHHAEYFSM